MNRLINNILNVNDSIAHLEREKIKQENKYNQLDREHKELLNLEGKHYLINEIRKDKDKVKELLTDICEKLSKIIIFL
jgi:hypothetical protein